MNLDSFFHHQLDSVSVQVIKNLLNFNKDYE